MTGPQIITTIVAVFGGLAGLGTLVDAIFRRRKSRADAAEIITNNALKLVGPMEERIDKLEARQRRMALQVNRLQMTLSAMVLEILNPDVTIAHLREVATHAQTILSEIDQL